MQRATSEGTQRYAAAHMDAGFPPQAYRVLGRTGLKVSALGFGTYRVSSDSPVQRDALKRALKGGCNLIDTSTNYTDGYSEACVGECLDEMFQAKALERDQVVVVSKVGYVQGHNLTEALKREKGHMPYPDMVKYADGCWHCIHPNFISDQLSSSLFRLKLKTIDVYLLHNPEYFLMHTLNTQPELSIDKVREIYYERITRAFRKLEDEVQAGRIGCYGVSSNTFGQGVHEVHFTSAESLWEIACHVSKDRKEHNAYDHHFSIVQMPANLLEVGPFITENCEEKKTTLEYCQEKELGVLINRPLNAIRGNQLVRLAEMTEGPGETSLTEQFKVVIALEDEFAKTVGANLDTGDKGPKPDSLFGWGRELKKAKLNEIGADQWKQLELKVIRPQVSRLCSALDSQIKGPLAKEWTAWRKKYLSELIRLLETVGAELSQHGHSELDAVKGMMGKLLPAALAKESLSRKAIAVLTNAQGVHCVLNGMRTPDYVEDSLGAMKLQKISLTKKNFQKLSEL